MNFEFNNRNSETIFVLVFSTLLTLFGIYYFQFLIFLYPILFIMLGVRHGLKYALINLAISAILIGLIIDIISGILMFIAFTPLTLTIIIMIIKRKSSIEVLISSTIVFLASVLLVIGFIDMNGVSIIGQLKMNITEIINSQMDLLGQMDLSNEEILDIKNLHRDYLQAVLAVIPSVIMIFSLAVSYLNYLLSTLLLRKLGYAIVYIPKFFNFKLPRNIFFGLAFMFLITFILNNFNLFNSFEVILNLIVLTFFVFFIQGISVIDYLLNQKKIKTLLRILILWFVIDLAPVFGILILILGLFDAIFDFRKLRSGN